MKRLLITCSLLCLAFHQTHAQDVSESDLRARLMDAAAKSVERMDAAYQLSKKEKLAAETVDALIAVIQDRSDPQASGFLRDNAIDALRRHPKQAKKAVPALLDVVRQDRGKEMGYLRYKALLALIDIAPREAASHQAFLEGLKDSEEAPRQSAVRGLALAPDKIKEFLPLLKERVSDDSAQVRAEVAKAAEELSVKGRSGEILTMLPELIALLKDKDSGVQGAAAHAVRALAEYGKDVSAALPALTQLLKSDHGFARKSALYALGQIGPAAASAVPEIAPLARHEDYFVRSASLSALKRIGTEEAREAAQEAEAKKR